MSLFFTPLAPKKLFPWTEPCSLLMYIWKPFSKAHCNNIKFQNASMHDCGQNVDVNVHRNQVLSQRGWRKMFICNLYDALCISEGDNCQTQILWYTWLSSRFHGQKRQRRLQGWDLTDPVGLLNISFCLIGWCALPEQRIRNEPASFRWN